MEKQLRYDLTADGFVAGIGYENYEHELTANEPFTLGSTDIALWQLVNGTWRYAELEQINQNWQSLYLDYKQARERLKQIVAGRGGFAALAPGEKRIAASWFAATPEEITSVLTLDEQLAARAISNEESRRSRTRRYYTAYELFEIALSTPDAVKVINSIMYHNLETLYIKLGFEGKGTFNYKGDEDQVSILDFINSTPGTKFETAGIAQLGLQPLNGLTVQELIDKAYSIIKHGY